MAATRTAPARKKPINDALTHDGARVRYAPKGARRRRGGKLPEAGELGTTQTTLKNGRYKTYDPEVDGGVVYVRWDDAGVVAVPPGDLRVVKRAPEPDPWAGATASRKWLDEEGERTMALRGPGRRDNPSASRAMELRGDFDPTRLGEGVYHAESSDPAYSLLRALGMTTFAEVTGERSLPGGRKLVVVRVKRPMGDGPFLKPNGRERMPIDPEYFKTVKREYSDWREKWWREVVQNAVDAGARRIDLGVTENEDGTRTAWCEDDAGGMSEEILRTKFLSFGGTTKRGVDGAAGGFGKAKELIVLPWLGWRVHSRFHVAVGVANEFDVEAAPEFRDGTRVEATMAADDCTTVVAARSFLAKCDLPGIQLRVNGEPVKARLRTKSEKLFSFGGDRADVYFNKGNDFTENHYFVRVKGPRGSLYTFSGYLSDDVGGSVIVEIVRPSIDILTANRDGFSDWRIARELEQFLARMAADVTSATRQKKGLIRQKFKGDGLFEAATAQQHESVLLSQMRPLRATKKAGRGEAEQFELDDDSLAKAREVIEHYESEREDRTKGGPGEQSAAIGTLSPSTATEMMTSVKLNGQEHLEAMVQQLVWQPDFYLMNDIEGFKVPKKFYPASMAARVLHLAKVWTELCRFVMIQLGYRERYGVGFYFSATAGAAHMFDDGHWLMLNPFVDAEERSEIWQPNKLDHLRWLYAAAIHECTHLGGVSLHNEVFATAMTRNVARCADGWKRIKQIVGSIRMRGAPSIAAPDDSAPTKTRGPRLGSNHLPARGPYDGYWLVEMRDGVVLDVYRETTGGEPLGSLYDAQSWQREMESWRRSIGPGTDLVITRRRREGEVGDVEMGEYAGPLPIDAMRVRVESPLEYGRRVAPRPDRSLPKKGPYTGYRLVEFYNARPFDVYRDAITLDWSPIFDLKDHEAWRREIAARKQRSGGDSEFGIVRLARLNEPGDMDMSRFREGDDGEWVRVDPPGEAPAAPDDGTERLPAEGPYPDYELEVYRGDYQIDAITRDMHSRPLAALPNRAAWAEEMRYLQAEYPHSVVIVSVPSRRETAGAYELSGGVVRRPLTTWRGGQ